SAPSSPTLGHLESAAGLIGVAKVLAAMAHGAVPASLHSSPRNPHIDWAALPVEVVDGLREWPSPAGAPRRAGVSGFGLSGTNAHVILEQAPTLDAPSTPPAPPLRPPLLLSARSEASLRARAAQLHALLGARPALDARAQLELAASLATRAEHFEHRACVHELAALAQLAEHGHALPSSARASVRTHDPRARGQGRELALVFSGQGAQRLGMGQTLRAHLPAFRDAFDALCSRFDAHLERPLKSVVFADPGSEAAALLDRTDYTQPALFALEVALARTLEHLGLRPTVLLGHSIGELAAAHVAGIFGLDDACRLVAARGRLMQALPPGAMASLQASADEVEAALGETEVWIAGLNGPHSTVVSGEAQAVAELAARFEARGRKVRRLQVSTAFHTPRVEPMLEAFAELAESLTFHPARVPVIPTVAGASLEAMSRPAYWIEQVRAPVRFAAGVEALARRGVTTVLELGPRAVLTPLVAATFAERDGVDAPTLLASMRSEQGELDSLIAALGALHCRGFAVDWARAFAPWALRPVPLPAYPFERRHHWLPSAAEAPPALPPSAADPMALAGHRVDLSTGHSLHTLEIGPPLQPYLGDHRVYDRLVVPGSFHMAVLLAIAESRWPGKAVELREVQFVRALHYDSEAFHTTLHVELSPLANAEGFEASAFILEAGARVELARGVLAPSRDDAPPEPLVETTRTGDFERPLLDALLDRVQITWGPRWWWIRGAERTAEGHARGRFAAPEGLTIDDAPLPGGFIDNSFALQAWARPRAVGEVEDTPQLPILAERLVWFGERRPPVHATLRLVEATADSTTSELTYYDAEGRAVARLEGFTTHRAPRTRLLDDHAIGAHLHRVRWQPVEAASVSPNPGQTLVLGDAPELDAFERLPDRAALLARLDAGAPAPARVIASFSPGAHATPREACVEALALAQTLLGDPRLEATALVALTRRAVACGAEREGLDLPHAPVWGLLRALQSEHPERTLALVDTDADPKSAATLSAALALAEARKETQVALRRGALLVPRLARSEPLPELPPGSDALAGTVLITGGTGAIGGRLARHLATAHGARHLTLLSRSGEQAPGVDALRAELEAAGAQVRVLAGDASQPAVLREALTATPPVRAIFHAAGVLADKLGLALTPREVAAVFGPKVDAARQLDALSVELDLELDHFVLFSSAAGVFGAAGQANYAAANATLDALAADRRARGLAGLSLAWGPWAEVGMAARASASTRSRMRSEGARPFAVREGLALLGLALRRASRDPDALSVPIHLTHAGSRRGGGLPLARAALRQRADVAADAPDSLDPRLSRGSVEARQLAVQALVREELAAVLGSTPEALAERLVPGVELGALGLDSLMAIELRNQLRRRSGVQLPATALFDGATVDSLGARIEASLSELEPAPEPAPKPAAMPGVRDYLLAQREPDEQPQPRPTKGSSYRVVSLLRSCIEGGDRESFASTCTTLLAMRRMLDAGHRAPEAAPVRLSEGASNTGVPLYCVPSLALPSSPLQFLRVAKLLGDRASLWSAANPGYELGDALPADLEGVCDYHAQAHAAIAERTGRAPVLVGYSSGGWFSAMLAARLEAQGRPAPGLVLLDTPHPFEWDTSNLTQMFVHDAIALHLQTHGDDDAFIHELTTMQHSIAALLEQWRDRPITATPTLHLACTRGMRHPGWGVDVATDPATQWGPRIADLDIAPCEADHAQLLTEGAEACAGALRAWLDARGW
ncbi:putative type I polyketide synthase, partial [Plesiocystis pacifica SIR-1]